MGIKILLGSNGKGKTEYLKSKVEFYRNQGKKVVCNIDILKTPLELSEEKISEINESDYVPDFGTYRKLHSIKQKNYKYYMSLIVAEGDILILDEPGQYLSIQQLNDMYWTLYEIKDLWEEIYISGKYEDGLFTFKDCDETVIIACNEYGNYTEKPGKELEEVMFSV
jgi:hypothetical protein